MEWVNTLTLAQKEQILELWNSEFPRQIAHENLASFENYLSKLEDVRHLLVEVEGEVRGWFSGFEREGETWFIIIISRKAQGLGLGKKLMLEAMKHYDALNGWIVNHQEYNRQDEEQYPSPAVFYQKLGFRVLPEVTLEKGGIVSTKIAWHRHR